MPAGYRYLQSSLSLTLEFATPPTDFLQEPVTDIIFHLAWPFLDPISITLLYVASPVMLCYRNLRAEASSLTAAEIHRICTPLDHITSTSSICSLRARNAAKILILCDFCPVGMIHCLGSVYTRNFLDFASIDACLLAISDIPVDPGDPPHNFPALQHVFHQYIFFKYSFRSAIRDMIFRNRCNNHCASVDVVNLFSSKIRSRLSYTQ